MWVCYFGMLIFSPVACFLTASTRIGHIYLSYNWWSFLKQTASALNQHHTLARWGVGIIWNFQIVCYFAIVVVVFVMVMTLVLVDVALHAATKAVWFWIYAYYTNDTESQKLNIQVCVSFRRKNHLIYTQVHMVS